MLLLLVACELPGAERHSTPASDDSTIDSTIEAPTDSTPPGMDSTPPEKKYACVALDQKVPEGAAPAASGYEYCSRGSGYGQGYTHRVTAVGCAMDWTTFELPTECGDSPGECGAKPGDCGAGALCESDQMGGCSCVPKCQSDADCDPGMACVPRVLDGPSGGGALYNRNDCVPAGCRTDGDCPSGGPCIAAPSPCGNHEAVALQCGTPADECRVEADCDDVAVNPICTWVDGHFECIEEYDCD